jgi:hypothetical protein
MNITVALTIHTRAPLDLGKIFFIDYLLLLVCIHFVIFNHSYTVFCMHAVTNGLVYLKAQNYCKYN